MQRAVLFFQADQWRSSVPSTWTQIGWQCGNYPNGEQWVRLDFPHMGAEKLLVMASFTDQEDLDSQLIRFLLVLEASQRAAAVVELFIPYLPYSLQDRDVKGGDAAAARVLMRSIEAMGVDKVTLVDLHNPQLMELWGIEAQQLYADEVLAEQIRSVLDPANLAVVAPDSGAALRAHRLSQLLGCPVLELEKERRGPGDVIVTGSVEPCPAQHFLLVDDMINTGGTMAEAAKLIREQCHVRVSVAITHALMAGQALAKLKQAEVVNVFATDSFLSKPVVTPPSQPQLHIVNVAQLLEISG